MTIKTRSTKKILFRGQPDKCSHIALRPVRNKKRKHTRSKSITALIQFKRVTKK